MHAPHWTCTARCNTHGKTRLIPDRGHVHYRPWDMPSTFFELVVVVMRRTRWGVRKADNGFLIPTLVLLLSLNFLPFLLFFTFHKSELFSCMLLRCRITRLAVTSWPLRACGSGTGHSGHLASHSRSFSGSCLALGTNTGHARPCARHQDNIAGRPAYLLLQPNNALAGASNMELPGNVATTLYDWRAFTTPGAQLHYIRTEDTANERIGRIASRQTPFVIGLDFEWRPTFVSGRAENPIALVQVACDDEILLVHVSAMQGKIFKSCPRARGRCKLLISISIN
jgi:hypothetical protein